MNYIGKLQDLWTQIYLILAALKRHPSQGTAAMLPEIMSIAQNCGNPKLLAVDVGTHQAIAFGSLD